MVSHVINVESEIMIWIGLVIGWFVMFFAAMVFLECRSKMIDESVSGLSQYRGGN